MYFIIPGIHLNFIPGMGKNNRWEKFVRADINQRAKYAAFDSTNYYFLAKFVSNTCFNTFS